MSTQPVDLSLSEGHTGGDWRTDGSDYAWLCDDGAFSIEAVGEGGGMVVASRNPCPGRAKESIANAELFKAAPAMRSELVRLRSLLLRSESVLNHVWHNEYPSSDTDSKIAEITEDIRAALSKAVEEQSR